MGTKLSNRKLFPTCRWRVKGRAEAERRNSVGARAGHAATRFHGRHTILAAFVAFTDF